MALLTLVRFALGIVLAYLSISLPFTLWLLRAFFQSLPVDLEHAAWVDRATRFQVSSMSSFPRPCQG